MHHKLVSVPLFVIAFLSLSLLNAQTKTDFFRIEDLQPGMKGIGKTCFRGARPEEFQVEILGVLRGVEPGANAVLARLNGELLDKIGVFEGMSGSPVFVDGKLLGAVAFTYPYAKEAICGITPIAQMIDSFEENAIPNLEFNIEVKGSPLSGSIINLPRTGGHAMEPEVASGDIRRQPGLADFGEHTLVSIATPLSLGGLDAKTLALFRPKFRAMGLSILQGVGGASRGESGKARADSESPPLEPGSNIVIPLIRGDLEVSAGGTVTYIDGNKIYAFGHSLLELGFTDLPIHKARTIFIFPSLESSFKILDMGEPVGTLRQDRGMGVFGVLGDTPRMMPLKVRLRTSRGAYREFSYELARDRLLTPLLVNLAVNNTIAVSERSLGVVTLDIQGKIRIKNEQAVEVYNRYSSDSGVAEAISVSAALPVNYLMAFGYKDLDIEGVDLEITAQENDRSALLDSIRLNRMEAKAGDSLELEISYKKANGETIQNLYPLKIPENAAPGPLNVLVADGTTVMSMDAQETEDEILVPRDLSQLIKLLNNLRKNDRLYVLLFRKEPGAVVRGEGLPGLPPSILSILGSERKTGAVSPIDVSTFQEFELPPTDYLAAGSRMLTIKINP
jgi:hypothetical protein